MTRARHANEGAAGQGHAHRLALASVDSVVAKRAPVDALGRDPRQAMRAGAVAIDEGCDYEVALRNAPHLGTDLFHDSDEFVADGAEIVRRLAAVVPEVRAAHTCKDDTDDRVRRRIDHRVRAFPDLDCVRSVVDGCAHDYGLSRDGAAAYSASLTCSPQVALLPLSSTSSIAMCVMKRVGPTPCQCSSAGSKNTRSPGRITSIGPPRRWARPTPSVTKMVWPFGCVCHAVRAPGVKRTLFALRRDGPDGAATESM